LVRAALEQLEERQQLDQELVEVTACSTLLQVLVAVVAVDMLTETQGHLFLEAQAAAELVLMLVHKVQQIKVFVVEVWVEMMWLMQAQAAAAQVELDH
jgi:predicted flavoprotein YhiN